MKLSKKQIILIAGIIIAIPLMIMAIIAVVNRMSFEEVKTSDISKPLTNKELRELGKIILEYKPNDKMHLVIYSHNEDITKISSTAVQTENIELIDGLTNKEIDAYDADDGDTLKIEIINNELHIIYLVPLFISTTQIDNFPFFLDRYYIKNETLQHTQSFVLKPPQLDEKTLKEFKEDFYKYKNNDKSIVTGRTWDFFEELLALAFSGDEEARQVLKDEGKFIQIYGNILDGHIGETYHGVAEYLILTNAKNRNKYRL